MTQSVDHVALLPVYLAAGTAVLVLLTDLVLARRAAVLVVAGLGALATAAGAIGVGLGDDRETFCVPDACSFVANDRSALVATLFALLTLGVIALSAATRDVPPGEYAFLLACSMTGGVALGSAGDLITLIVALETLTLPLYILVGLRRRTAESAEGAVTFFVVSVVATAVTLLGAALLYAVSGRVHFATLATGLPDLPLTGAAVLLVLAGLAFKVAAVPFHAWAPAAYDGAPVPVAAYLSTASKLGGVIAILYAVVDALRPALDLAGPALAVLAVLTMTVGNLVALRQTRMVRLLAWSSVAQAGYILAPLGAFMLADGRTDEALSVAVAAAVAYTVFYVLLELTAFGAVVALRSGAVPAGAHSAPPGRSEPPPSGLVAPLLGPDVAAPDAVPVGAESAPARPDADGGLIADYRGAARTHPWVGAALVLALVGLAGLPPGLAGLFAKVVVVRSLLDGSAGWLAVVVAINAVIGLAYYVRVAAVLYGPVPAGGTRSRIPWAVAAALGAAALAVVVAGFAPQVVLDLS